MSVTDHSHTIIQLSDVSFAYGDEMVLEHVTIPVHRGDYLAIVGPNGGGKSTLLRVLLGLETPRSGSVSLFGQDIKKFKGWKKIGYVSQLATHIDVNFPMTVQEVVLMGRFPRLGLLQLPGKKDHEAVENALKEVGMWEYRDRRIGDLSGGQKQRVFIARCLAGEPEVIILDEPTVGVDVKTQKQFYALLQKLNTTMNLTLILVTHELDVVDHEATEIAYINKTLVYHGVPKNFVHTEYFARLSGKEDVHV